jgi:predicted nucleic acid-binding protein
MEKTADSPIIADTSTLVSLATDTDHNHIPAKEAAKRLRDVSRPIILPVDIFVETVNVLGKKAVMRPPAKPRLNSFGQSDLKIRRQE